MVERVSSKFRDKRAGGGQASSALLAPFKALFSPGTLVLSEQGMCPLPAQRGGSAALQDIPDSLEGAPGTHREQGLMKELCMPSVGLSTLPSRDFMHFL